MEGLPHTPDLVLHFIHFFKSCLDLDAIHSILWLQWVISKPK